MIISLIEHLKNCVLKLCIIITYLTTMVVVQWRIFYFKISRSMVQTPYLTPFFSLKRGSCLFFLFRYGKLLIFPLQVESVLLCSCSMWFSGYYEFTTDVKSFVCAYIVINVSVEVVERLMKLIALEQINIDKVKCTTHTHY